MMGARLSVTFAAHKNNPPNRHTARLAQGAEHGVGNLRHTPKGQGLHGQSPEGTK